MRAKDVAIISGIVVTLSTILCCLSVIWDSKKAVEKERALDTPELAAMGKAFGKRGDQRACETEAHRRVKSCQKLALQTESEGVLDALGEVAETMEWCGAETMHFHKHCLSTAAESEGFCDGVPESPAEFYEWASRKCELIEIHPNSCAFVFETSAAFCYERRTKTAPVDAGQAPDAAD